MELVGLICSSFPQRANCLAEVRADSAEQYGKLMEGRWVR